MLHVEVVEMVMSRVLERGMRAVPRRGGNDSAAPRPKGEPLPLIATNHVSTGISLLPLFADRHFSGFGDESPVAVKEGEAQEGVVVV
jgi:hypothetical protein